jgi:hypothetical protein
MTTERVQVVDKGAVIAEPQTGKHEGETDGRLGRQTAKSAPVTVIRDYKGPNQREAEARRSD